MRSFPSAILLTLLFSASGYGCEFDFSQVPVSRVVDASEPSGTSDAGVREGGTPSAPPTAICPGAECEFVSLCGGDRYTCGVAPTGRAVCWGDNTFGQLGRKGSSQAFGYVQAQQNVLLEGIAQLACGTRHVCAVLNDHTVRCWGAGDEGQLGRGVVANEPYASESLTLAPADQVVAGTDVSCARLQTGQVSCWGKNKDGQLGRGTVSNDVLEPQIIPQLGEVSALSLRTRTIYAIAGANRTLLAWGHGRGPGPVAIQDETWSGPVIDVRSVAAGSAHGCFVAGAEKRVYCTGWDEWGQSGQGAKGCDGWCENAQPVQRTSEVGTLLSGVDELLVSAHSNCVLIASEVHCWGANSYGELGIGVANFAEFAASKTQIRTSPESALAPEGEPGTLTGVSVLGAGYRHFCAQRKRGELLCWGDGQYGQIGLVLGSSPRPMVVPAP